MTQQRQFLYPAIFHKETSGQYSVAFPDLNGCFASAETFEEAYFQGQKALAIYVHYANHNLATPSSLITVQANNPIDTVVLIGVDADQINIKPRESIKKNLSLPKWLNDIATAHDLNFSQILKDAVIAHLLQTDSLSYCERRMLED